MKCKMFCYEVRKEIGGGEGLITGIRCRGGGGVGNELQPRFYVVKPTLMVGKPSYQLDTAVYALY